MTTSWSRIALLYAIGVLAAGQLGIVPPLVPELQRDLGLSLAGAGTAVSVITLVGAVLGLPAGGWSQRIGHARALAIGLAIMAVAAALCAAANDAATLLAGRTLAGIGYLLVVVAGPPLMAATAEPRHQPMTLSLWGTFVPTGIALAGLAAAGSPTGLAHDLRGRSRAAGRRGDRDGPRRAARWRRGARRGEAAGRRACRFPAACRRLLLLRPALPGRRRIAAGLAGRAPWSRGRRRRANRRHRHRLRHPGQPPGRLADARRRVARPARGDRPAGLDGAGRALLHGAAAAQAIVGFALSFAIGGLVPAATFASVPLVAGNPRAIGPINGLVAQAGSLGSLAGPPLLAVWVDWTGLAVRANAAARDRGAGRSRGARCQTRFSTTMNHVLPANGTSRPRESTG